MFKSIRWKFIVIYFLLVFIAMMIVGIFIMQQLESYHLTIVRDNLTRIVSKGGLMESVQAFDDLENDKIEIQNIIETRTKGLNEEIFLIDSNFTIIASSNNSLNGKSAIDMLDEDIIIEGFKGEVYEQDTRIASQESWAKNMIFPIIKGNEIQGVIYLRADLKDVYDTMAESRSIFLRALIIALIVTVLMGYFIARSITVPIIDVTQKAEKMAKGDFNQIVEVKSDDEIGRLAEMFNFLREKLNITLSEISNEKSKLETILQYMADGLISIDNEGNIIHANPAAMQMINLTSRDVESKKYNEIMGPINIALTLEQIKAKNEHWIGTEVLRFKEYIYYIRYAPFKDESGNKIGIIMALQDITERYKYENMQKEFVANVSHELKTPLTSIKSYAETLLDGAVEDPIIAEKFLKVIDSEADRMNRLVKDLLQLSRLDYKKEKLNKKLCNIVEIVNLAVEKMTINAKNKNQKIKVRLDHEMIGSMVDKDRMEQVILNIISNAIKYTPDEGVIEVTVQKDEKYGYIIVEDDGIGISQDELPKLFERFYRVDKARSRALGGTGLGLSIARQIMIEHEGEILIKSEEGKGTEVTIRIPIYENA